MSWARKAGRWARFAGGLGAVVSASAAAWVFNQKRVESGEFGSVHASWTTNFKPSVAWDHNWDRRDPAALTHPNKNGKDVNNNEEKSEKKRLPTASRHLLLIRHGQYNMEADNDSGRYLTPLGREQASLTGARLKELGLPYDVLVNSTMTRATETAQIIKEHLGDVKTQSCDLIREGAPIPPEPPVGHWRPEAQFFEDGPRIEAGFRKYFQRCEQTESSDSYEVIVCHANVIRYYVCSLAWKYFLNLLHVHGIMGIMFCFYHDCPKEFFVDGSRIEAGFRKYFHRADVSQSKDSYEILSCHGNVIRYFVCRALQFPPEAWLRMSLHHGSITWITIRPSGRVALRALGDSGHLPADKLTTS